MPVRLVPISSGKAIKLDKPVLLVGRNPGCDVILKQSRKVSRTHCLIACVDNAVLIRDLGSTNGVWINSQRVERDARLRIGDELSVADVRYHLVRVEQKNGQNEAAIDDDGRSDPRENEASEPDRERRRQRDAQPLDAGQNVPIAIPEEEDSFLVEASAPRLPRVSPKALAAALNDNSGDEAASRPRSDPRIPLLDDDSDDVIPLDLPEPLSDDDSQEQILDAGLDSDDGSFSDRPIIPLDD